MIRAKLALIIALAVPTFSACGGPIPTVAFGATPADYARPMVAKKLDVPVYLLNETTNLPDAGNTKDKYPVPYTGLGTFVSRDLKGVFDLYYSNVSVVEAADIPAEEAGLIVSVRIDSLGYETQTATSSSGATAQTNHPYMKWALGIKAIGAEEYLYTLTASSIGSQGFSTKSDVVASFHKLMGDAVSDFLKSYIEKNVHAAITQMVESSGASEESSDEDSSDE